MSRIHSSSALIALLLLAACGDKDGDTDTDTTDGCDERSWFLDADGDGHGGDETASACEAPEGFVAQSTDCDDDNPGINPDAAEVCDGADNNCDGDIDTGATDTISAFTDADADGFGDDGAVVEVCEVGAGTSAVGGDCDDDDAAAFPGALEVCDGVDNDCDGATDGISVPGDHATIGEALDAAADGDLVCVAAGDYPESLYLESKAVRLGGAGVDQTRITGVLMAKESVSRAVSLYAADGSEISDMTIKGLGISNTQGLTVENVELSGNGCTLATCTGVGLYVERSTVDLLDVVLTDLSVTGSGTGTQQLEGLAFASESDLVWTGGGIIDNTIDYGATSIYGYGLLSLFDSSLEATDFSIEGNVASLEASGNSGANVNFNGLLYGQGADLDFTDVTIRDNEITATSTLTGVHASGSSNAQANAWFHLNGGSLSWVGGGLIDNANTNTGGSSAYGYATYISADPTVLEDIDIHGNMVQAWGTSDEAPAGCAGLYTNGGTVSLLRVDMRDNTMDCGADSAYQYGLAVHWNGVTTYDNVVVANNEVSSNAWTWGLLSFNYQTVTPALTNITVVGNTMDSVEAMSGVLHGYGNGLDVVNAAITNNWVTVSYYSDTEYPAAAVMMLTHNSSYTFAHSTVFGNGSSSGAGYIVGGTESYSSIVGQNGTFDANPLYADVTTTEGVGWDLSPGSGSPLVDAGDPGILDDDGSVSDIGAYGGPEGTW